MQGSGDMKLRKNFARTNYFKIFYFNRIVDSLNSLPSSIQNSSNLKTFRCNLMKYLAKSILIFEYDVILCNTCIQ